MAARRVEERLAAEPDLAAEYARLKSLRVALRSARESDLPSDALRHRLGTHFARPPAARYRSWRAVAASLIVGILLGGGATFGILQPRTGEISAAPFIAAHVRALMAPLPVDVASSDHHTVKPWFDGKLAFAPQVVDLASQGFPLVGGRVDIVDMQPVPALVYRAGKHLISLTEVPGGGSSSVAATVDRGFEVLHWSDGGAGYWAVSDSSNAELRSFVAGLRAAVQ
jgi:anti-sigma factor RsiW